ncbi:MAG: orotidine-5'-phosphate decarboxylase, partial [Planctomycetota bacterium]
MTSAFDRLRAAQRASGSLVSVGLEPAAKYMPPCFEATIAGYRAFLESIVEAAEGSCAAFKLNVAFFESLGTEGFELMHEVREMVPPTTLLIADAKRGDILTTAEHYARAIYEELGADSTTVNPLMGHDAVEPFLAYRDSLTFVLALTSNPSAKDFLLEHDLYLRIAEQVAAWNGRDAVHSGLVVGATRPE